MFLYSSKFSLVSFGNTVKSLGNSLFLLSLDFKVCYLNNVNLG